MKPHATRSPRPPARPARPGSAARSASPARPARPARRLAAWRRWLRWPRISRLLRRLLAVVLGSAALAWSAGPVYAQVAPGTLPTGGVVVSGQGTLASIGSTLTVHQSSARLGIDWQSFSIGRDALVEFLQPGPGAVALNRVVGHEATQIYGRLRANGQVFLTNPNGVLFAPGAKVDVGGLVASTLDLSQADFAAGHDRFRAGSAGAGSVVNEGEITARAGGYIALFGPTVDNRGELRVDAGSVVLASGRAATVSISGAGLISAVVDPGVAGSVLNSGRIAADGGSVRLDARSADALASSLVNNSGIVRANALEDRNGEIWITGDRVVHSGALQADGRGNTDGGRVTVLGDMARGTLEVSGTISARAEAGRGGAVETSAAKVSIAPTVRVDTRAASGAYGRWLIDPTDFTVSEGSAPSSGTGIGSATLSTNLDLGSVELATLADGTGNGDLFVNGAVTWDAATTLTLRAHRNVEVNREIFATGAGNLVIDTDTDNNGSGRFTLTSRIRLPGAGSFTLDNVGYIKLRSAAELQAVALGGNYILANDIDVDTVANWNPIGSETSATFSGTTAFTGRLDGLGHRLTGQLTIDNTAAQNLGLFAMLSGATVRNLEIESARVTGGVRAGVLAGSANGATSIENVQVGTLAPLSGQPALVVRATNAAGAAHAGGLLGTVGTGTTVSLQRVHVNPDALASNAEVTATGNAAGAFAGGVVGSMYSGGIDNVVVHRSDIDASAGATGFAGGVVGDATASIAGATVETGGAVIATGFSGGIAGRWTAPAGGRFEGNVSGAEVLSAGHAGGLIGHALGTGSISDSDAFGPVSTTAGVNTPLYAGGAVGWYALSGSPSDIRASGNVSGGNTVGGVIGYLQSSVALGLGSIVSEVPTGTTKTVTGQRWTGGLIGYSDSTSEITGLSFAGSVTTTLPDGATGGLIGHSSGRVANSSSSGTVTAAGIAGGLVGRAQGSGGFSNVSSTASVTTTNTGTSLSTGGLVGYFNHAGALTGGTATGAVSGNGKVGGLVGWAQSPSGAVFGITDSTASGNVTLAAGASSYGGGLVGQYNMTGAMERVSASGSVSGADAAGGLVGYFQSAAALSNGAQTGTTVSGFSWVGGLVGYSSSSSMTTVSAVANVSTASGGTSNVGGLAGLTEGSINGATATGTVAATATGGTAYAGGLVGRAQGSGRTITGATASGNVSIAATTGNSAAGGLVGYATHGTISASTANGAVSGGLYSGGVVGLFQPSAGNLTGLTATGSVSSRGDAGGIVAYASGSGSLSSSTASGTVSTSAGNNYSVGGAVGYTDMSGGISGVTASGTVSGGANTGGIVGWHNTTGALATVTASMPSVTGGSWVGGIVGYSRAASIDGLTATANVTQASTGGAAGGLAGYHDGAIRNSSASGSVTGNSHAGGLIGQGAGSGERSNLSASGAVSSGATSGGIGVGGLIGYLSGAGSLADASATGNVSGGGYSGGLVGYFNANASSVRLRASGNVTTTVTNSVGGLIGYADGSGSVVDAEASGNVTAPAGANYVGGLFGFFGKPGGLDDAHATGNVTGGSRTGGLVGYYAGGGNLSNASASGRVTGGSYAGGLVGDFVNSGNLTDATATGIVSGTSYAGGLVGSFYDSGLGRNLRASGSVTGTSYVGGLFGGWQYSETLTDSLASGAVTGISYVGGLAGYVYDNAGLVNSSASGPVTSVFVAGGLFGEANYTSITRGTATGRVLVAGRSGSTGYGGGLVGQYFTNRSGGGIFDSTASGEVRVDMAGGFAAGLVAYHSGGSIERSGATGNVTGVDSGNPTSTSHLSGGLVGYMSLRNGDVFTTNTASGAVDSAGSAGGLVGEAEGGTTVLAIANSSASGSVVGRTNVGGLIGRLQYIGVTNGTATGNVRNRGTTGNTGGLVGEFSSLYANSSIIDSRASGDVTGGDTAGGLIGYRFGWTGGSGGAAASGISDSTATGDVSNARIAGGLVGRYSGTFVSSTQTDNGIRRSQASGDVSGRFRVGGLVGEFTGYGGLSGGVAVGGIVDSMATGNVTLAYDNISSQAAAGGLVGYHAALTRTVTAGTELGAIVRSTASGNVTLAPTAAISSTREISGGGLAGFVDGPNAASRVVVDSYATGAVSLLDSSGRMRAGGLVGQTDASLDRTYAIGRVEATGLAAQRAVGGLVGLQTATTGVTPGSNFWATDTTGQASSAMGTASTLAELRTPGIFDGWDVALSGGAGGVWRMYSGQTTPLLRALLTPLTVSLSDVSKVYDGTASLGSVALTIGGASVLEPQNIFIAGTAVDAGSYTFGAANVYSNQLGYDLTVSGSATLTISRRPLTLAGLVADKEYDGTTAATLVDSPVLGGLVAGEDLVFEPGAGFGAAFASKAAGLDRTVTLTGTYSIRDGAVGKASNYLPPSTTTTTADILPRPVNIGGLSAVSRPYDGTTTVQVTASGTVTGVLAGDTVSFDPASVTSGTIPSKNVGTRPVTVSGTLLGGPDGANYRVTGADALTVVITPQTLVMNGLTADNRTYDASTDVTVRGDNATLSGLVAGDSVLPVIDRLRGSIADKNVGDGRPVTVTGAALRGFDAANYLVAPGAVSVNISPRPLTISLQFNTSSSRVYDGTTSASTSFPRSWLFGDDITVSATSVGFADKNVAYTTGGAVTSKPVTATGIAISGADAGNYALQNTTATINGTITPKPLTVSGVAAVNRVYDGTRDVSVSIAGATVDTSAVVAGDVVSVSTPSGGTVVGQMADKNIGNAKPVTVPGLALTGDDALNYTITGSGSGVTVNITRKPVTATYTALGRVYNGNAQAAIDVTTSDFISGDAVNFYIDDGNCSLSCGYAYFVTPGSTLTSYTLDKSVGTDKPVLVISNNFLYGSDSGNYLLLNPRGPAAPATVTQRTVTLSFSGGTKVYDGTTAGTATLNRGGSSVFFGDDVTTTLTAVYTGTGAKNVGTGKPMSISDIVLSGPDAANYIVSNTTATATGAITAKPITVSGITATNRPYDGTTTVAVTAGTVGSSGFVDGDIVSVSLPPGGLSTGTIATPGAGADKPVTVTGLSLTGSDAPNYSIDSTSSGITVDILQRALVPTFSAPDKIYDGGISAVVSSTTSGIVSGDAVTFTQTARFVGTGAKNVGSDKTIEVTDIRLGGSAAANYSLASTTATTTGNIVPKSVTVNYVGGSRVYNGLADRSAPVVGSSLQFVAGDLVGVTQTALFSGDGSAGSDKPVSISGVTLTGADAFNYTLGSSAASTTATVTQRPLSVAGVTATSRVYDGTTSVAVNVSGATVDTSAVIAGDRVSIALPPDGISTGTMADRFVGNAKPVTISGASLAGEESANYVLVGATGLTVNIAPRPLTASYSANDKVYDGSATATIVSTATDLLGIDAGGVGISAIGVFSAGKGAGDGKAVAVSGGFLTGALAGNYTLANPTGSSTASITPRTLSLSYGGITKVYDGLTAVSVASTLTGRVTGDVVATTQTAEFTGTGAKNVGTGKPVAISGITLTGADAANYRIVADTATATGSITPRSITISGLDAVTAVDRVYDGTTTVSVVVPAGVTLTPVSGDILSGDSVTIAVPGSGLTTGTMADRHVGDGKPVNITGLTLDGADAINYRIVGTAGVTVDISPLALTATWAGVNRIYDGTTAAQASGSAAGIVAGDSVLIRGNGVFTDGKNVGPDKPISITSALLSGSEARNYTLLNPTGSASADVTRRTVTPAYGSVTKVYDGNTTAPVTPAFGGLIAGDAVTPTQTAQFTGPGARNAGTGKTVSVTDIALTGADAGNYQLAGSTATTSGSITPRPITLTGLTGVTAEDRVYDGTTAVAVRVTGSGPITVDPAAVVPGDDVSVNPLTGDLTSGRMADKHVGTLKPVVVDGLALTGADAANYRVAATDGVTVNITPRALTASYAGVDKIYDGSAAATVLGASSDILSGDTVSIGGSAVFAAGKNAGTDLLVNVTAGLLGGSDARNYRLTNPTGSTTADILPKTVTALYSGGSRVYDGTVGAPVLGSVGGLVAGDAVTLSQSAVFTGPGARNAGSDKPVAVSGITLAGADAANYRLGADSATTTATVTPRPLRIVGLTGVTATDRVYDGTREVQVTVTTSGPITPEPGDLIAGDEVTLTAPPAGTTIGLMADKHVGTDKPVAVAGLTIGGADAANYSVATTAGVTVSITPRSLTPLFVGTSRVYDGTTTASATGSSADILAGDSVLILGSGVFTGDGARNAGLNKPISITSATLGGLDGRNYLLTTSTGSATADITPRTLGTAYAGVARVYDGTTDASVTRTLSNLVSGDSVSVTETARFGDGKNVGSGKPVLVSGITLSGTDAANYRLDATTATTTASVTPRLLTVTGLAGLTATDRVYDGTLDVAVSFGSGGGTAGASNIVPGDDVAVAFTGGGGARMLDKNAGLAKPVTLTGLTLSGADAGNYLVGGVSGLTVNIAPRAVTLSGVLARDRVYDGTTTVAIDASGATLAGAISGDLLSVSASATGSMADKRVGTDKPVSVAGLALSGADAGNYVVVDSAPVTVSITAREVSASFAGVNKVYDGTTNASITLTASGLVDGDAVSLGASAAFTGPGARNAGVDKPVTVSALTLSGADASNYRLLSTGGSTTATITPRPLSAGATVAPRVYDGTTTASVSLVSSGVIDGDAVTLTGTATYTGPDGRNAGVGKPVSVSGLTLSGADAGNYTLDGITSLPATGTITPRPLTLAMSALDKVYDGDTAARVSLSADLIAGDDLGFDAAGARFAQADAGSGLRVSIASLALSGADRGNYQLPATLPEATASILRAPLTITAGALEKLYGSVLVPPGTAFSASGLVGSQTVGEVTLSSDGLGALQPVTATGYALVPSAARGGSFNPLNYDIRYRDGTLVVRPRPVTISSDFVVAFENELDGLGFTATVSGLLPGLGHGVTGLVPPTPDLRGAIGGSRITLLHSNGNVTGTDARNYELRYEPGQLLVLPRPVRLSDVPDGGGDGGFGISSFTEQEVAAANAALQEALRVLSAPPAADGRVGPGLRLPGEPGALTAAELLALFGTDARQITLPALQRLPLISLDPTLQRLIGAALSR